MKLDERKVNRVGKHLAKLASEHNRLVVHSQPSDYVDNLISGYLDALIDLEIGYEVHGPSPSSDFYSVIYVQGKMFVPKAGV